MTSSSERTGRTEITATFITAVTAILLAVSPTYAQFSCGMQHRDDPAMKSGIAAVPPGSIRPIASHQGVYIPVSGMMRGLIVYVQSREDQVEYSEWPINEMPKWGSSLGDSLTTYFREISGGRLDMQFDTYPEPMILGYTEGEFSNSFHPYGDAMRWVVGELDKKISFERYDLWSNTDSPFIVRPGPDGKVDLILIIHRHVLNKPFMPFAGISDLQFEGFALVDSLKRFVYGGNGLNSDAGASGLILTRSPGAGIVTEFGYAFGVAAHEINHKLLGDGHFVDSFSGLGILSSNGGSLAYNSMEKHFLGYITFNYLQPGVDTVITLHDYLSNDEAYALTIPESPSWYLTMEFRGKQSRWDGAPKKGIYLYHFYDSWSANQKQIALISSEGKWRWGYDSTANLVYKKESDPLGGATRVQRLTIDGKRRYADGYQWDTCLAFTMNRPLLAPYWNPTPDFPFNGDTIQTKINLRVLEMTDTTATVSISYTEPPILSFEGASSLSFDLRQSYPNPVSATSSASMTIPFTLAQAARVQLAVYDVFGRRVAEAIDGFLEAGEHAAAVQTDRFAPGRYVYELSGNGVRARKSFVVVK